MENLAQIESRENAVNAATQKGNVVISGSMLAVGEYTLEIIEESKAFSVREVEIRRGANAGKKLSLFLACGEIKHADSGKIADKGSKTVAVDADLWKQMRSGVIYSFDVESYEIDGDNGEKISRRRSTNWRKTS